MRNLLLFLLMALPSLSCGLLAGDATVLFTDDFSDVSSGWDRVSTTAGITDYADGTYRIFVTEPRTDAWANPGLHLPDDVVVEVRAMKAGGPDDNDFGVLCRYQDTGNFYFFLISSDGYYGIGIVENGAQQVLSGNGKLQPSKEVQPEGGQYSIRAECKGSRLTLFVNGSRLESVQSSALTGGDVGLIAGTFDKPGVDIRFDDFTVSAPRR